MAIAFEVLEKCSQIPRTLSLCEPSQTRFSYFWRKFFKKARFPESHKGTASIKDKSTFASRISHHARPHGAALLEQPGVGNSAQAKTIRSQRALMC